MSGRRRGGSNLGVLMLGAQLINIGVENVPPVTLSLIVGQAAIFLDFFHKYFPSAYGVCMSSYLVTKHRDWYRMILGSLFHADDMHLYFNMVSLLYKGMMLERMFGSPYFAYLVSVFTGLTSATYVGLGMLLGQVLHPSYFTSCAVGFSGVIFALKVLSTEYSPRGTQYAFGIVPIPSKYIFWVELVLIQLITPNASFVGHLAGILVGLAYTRGPLKPLMDSFLAPDGPQGPDNQAPQSGYRNQNGSSSFLGGMFHNTPTGPHYPPRYRQPTRWNTPGMPFSFLGRFFRNSGPRPHYSHPNDVHGEGFAGSSRAHPSAPPAEEDITDPNGRHTMPQPDGGSFDCYTGGLDEDEQLRRAMEESIRQQQQAHPSRSSSSHWSSDDENEQLQRAMEESMRQSSVHSSSSHRLYPDLNDLRSRRAQHFQ